jgi:hypothetical protein
MPGPPFRVNPSPHPKKTSPNPFNYLKTPPSQTRGDMPDLDADESPPMQVKYEFEVTHTGESHDVRLAGFEGALDAGADAGSGWAADSGWGPGWREAARGGCPEFEAAQQAAQ